jgi:osmotically-inducible protein OsmY
VIGCSKRSNDQTIAQDVQRKLAADPVAKDSTIMVIVRDGKVTLKDAVKDSATQRRLEPIAREEPGTRDMTEETAVVTVPTSNIGAMQRS